MRTFPHMLRARSTPLFALVCCLAFMACRSPEERFASHVARAEELAAAGQNDEAILEYRSALNIDASSAEINQRVALLMKSQGAVENAAHYFLEAYRLDANRIEAAMRYVNLIARTNRRRANDLVAAALEKANDQAIVHRTVSFLSILDGDLEKALESAQKAIELDAQDPENWIQLGRTQHDRARLKGGSEAPNADSAFRESVAAFDRADELRGGDVAIRFERTSVIAAWKPQSPEVRRAYVETLEFAVNHAGNAEQALAANAVASYAKAVGDLELQARALRTFIAIYPDTLGHWQTLAQIEGDRVYTELLEARPDDPRAHLLFANYLTSQGKDATSHLDDVLSRGLESPVLWDELIRRRLNRAQMKQALSALDSLEDQAPDHPATRRAQARVAIAKGENKEAVKLLRSVPTASRNSDGRRLLALAEYRRGNLDAAEYAIVQSIALSREVSYPALRLKARIHYDAEDWLLAFQTFTQIIDADIELKPEEQIMAASTLYERRRRAAGRAMLLAVLGSKNAPPRAAVEYARREGEKDPVGAMLYLTSAHKRSPDNFALLRAMINVDRRNPAKGIGLNQALKRVNDAVLKSEGGIKTLLLRAEILTDLGLLDRAENDALRAFEAAPSMPGAVDLLIQIYRDQNKLAEARKSFEEAEQAGVLHAGARRLLGRLYAEQGEFGEAVAMLERVMEESPEMVGATRDLARVLAGGGNDRERALELARDANERQRGNPRSASTLAFVYFQNDLHDEALREYQRAIRLDRTTGERMTPTLFYHLGLTLQKLDQNERATKAFESALAISSDFPEADDALQQLKSISSS